MILTKYEPTPWTITLTLEIILITIGIYWTQKIDSQQNRSPNDTTEMNLDSLINLARNLSILIDKTKLTPLEIRATSCKMNLTKGRNQTTVKSIGISDFLQQLKDLPDWAFRIVIDELRKQNMIKRITKEQLRTVIEEIKRRKEISVSTVPRQGFMTEKENTPAARCLELKEKTEKLMLIIPKQGLMIRKVKLPKISIKELLEYFGK